MKIFEITNENFGKAFKRISAALRAYSPNNVEWTSKQEEADLTFIHVVGGEEYVKLLDLDLSKTVIYQHCVYTTSVELNQWQPLWKDAALVVTWNELHDVVMDGTNYLRLPLGADPNSFNKVPKINKNIDVFATGHVAKTECIDLVYEACKSTGKVLHHTGENFRYSPNWYKYMSYMDEGAFASTLSRAKYVTGLRDIEGFEMACIEAAMTGSVPIIPNLPCYDFYFDFGKKINMSGDITAQLVEIFNSSYETLSDEMIDYVRDEFSWNKIMGKLFAEIR